MSNALSCHCCCRKLYLSRFVIFFVIVQNEILFELIVVVIKGCVYLCKIQYSTGQAIEVFRIFIQIIHQSDLFTSQRRVFEPTIIFFIYTH